MSLLFRNLQPFFAPEDVTGSGTPTITPSDGGGEMGKEDMIDFLSSDDEDKEILEIEEEKSKGKPKGKSKSASPTGVPTEEEETTEEIDEEEEEDELPDELEELEHELEGPTDEQLELITPVRRREILKKYPNLFKDFPYLEKAYYREQQFTELLPTIEDAKIAVEKAQTLDRFEADVIQGGNTVNILKAVKEENPKAFFRIVDNYLTTLADVDEQAYLHVLGNVSKHTIMAMVREAEHSKNDALKAAAQILNQFIFGTSEFTPPKKLSSDKPEEKGMVDEIKRREQAFLK